MRETEWIFGKQLQLFFTCNPYSIGTEIKLNQFNVNHKGSVKNYTQTINLRSETNHNLMQILTFLIK